MKQEARINNFIHIKFGENHVQNVNKCLTLLDHFKIKQVPRQIKCNFIAQFQRKQVQLQFVPNKRQLPTYVARKNIFFVAKPSEVKGFWLHQFCCILNGKDKLQNMVTPHLCSVKPR